MLISMLKSETGTGKTLAFLLPMIHQLQSEAVKVNRDQGTRCIILSPTRELVIQIYNVLQPLISSFHWITPGMIMGGEQKQKEKSRLRKGVNIVIATPGRLLDHLQNTQSFIYTQLRWLIMDEADRLLDMGFEQDLIDIINIINKIPKTKTVQRRQNVLVSATLKPEMNKLVELVLADPDRIGFSESDRDVNQRTPLPAGLTNQYLQVEARFRLVALAAFMRAQIQHAQAK